MTSSTSWFFWAFLSAGFAALTAIFDKLKFDQINDLESKSLCGSVIKKKRLR